MILQRLEIAQKIHPPKWLSASCHYLTITGSMAYGVSTDSSDWDIYGFCISPKDNIFPHLRGEIPGFGRQIQRFDQWQQHHIDDGDKQYDFQVFSIVKFFQLCMDNNPNMIDALFTPVNCVIHSTQIGQVVRENRKLFLHKGAWPKFKGYAYSQVHKMQIKEPPEGKRKELVDKFGFDVKFAYHVVRLLSEVEQILTEGDLDLQRNNEQLKAIRRGEWTLEQVVQHFADKERQLEEVYNKSKLPFGPDEAAIKALLLRCLEMHYGSLSDTIVIPGLSEIAMQKIAAICDEYGRQKCS